ncbi:MAG TPA: ATP-binding cassette domain-containing protein [Solirubrobacteraceae bacterium]|nr:ATP-binding cassette domain-containing protein [Solirubrobacteraceae bacterium]
MSLLGLSGVGKRYEGSGDAIEVLRDLDFDIYGGEFVGIWGSEGAGRTTFARIAAGLEAPTAGTVEYIGEDIARLALEDRVRLWRYGIAWLDAEGPADEQITARAYVAEPLVGREERSHALERASQALENFELGEVLDECWADLEDVDRAIAEIVRALLRLPKLLVLDDLTARIHFDECEYVMSVLRRLAEEKLLGVLLTTSKMSDLLHVHRFAWLSDGQLIEPRPGGPIAKRLRAVPLDGTEDLTP